MSMIKKNLFILLSLFILSSCNQAGGTKIKNLADLTPPLFVENNQQIAFDNVNDIYNDTDKKTLVSIANTDIISKPAVAKKVFYSVEKSGFVSAYSLKEDKQLWRTNIKGDIADRFFVGGGILYSNGKLYVTNGTRYLVVLDAETGIEEFRKEFSDIVRTKPVMTEGNKLFVQTVSNKLYAIDSQKFNVIWIYESGVRTINSGNYIHPTIFEDVVIAGFNTGELIALNIETGQPKWRYQLTNNENITLPGFTPATVQTQPIIFNDFMYFATGNGKLIRIYLYTGLPVWVKEAHDIHSMTIHSGKLLVTNNARQVAVIDASNGETNWVGNLITEENKQKRKVATVKFLNPFVSIMDGYQVIHVAASDGNLYNFKVNDAGDFPVWPTTSVISKGAKYQWFSCCDGQMHFIINRKIVK